MVARYPVFEGDQKCATIDPEAYFPEDSGGHPRERAEDAKRLCEGCFYLEPCRDWAIQYLVKGIWGGMTEAQRKKARHKRRIRGISLDAERLKAESVAQQKERRRLRRTEGDKQT